MQYPYSNITLLKQHLEPLGYSAEGLTLADEEFTRFTAPNANVWIANNDKTYYPFVSTGSKLIMKSKIWSNDFVEQLGGNIPATYKVKKSDANSINLRAILSNHESVIVKPFDSTQTHGLTTDISDETTLRAAIDSAYEFSDIALVQEQVYGDDIRFIILDGKVEGVILRQTPRVVGDGTSTISELIKMENQFRSTLELPFGQHYRELDENHVSQAHLQSEEVLPKGAIRELSRQVLVRRGASVLNITDSIHPSYIETIEKISAQLGNGYLAVDAFIANYEQPSNDNNYWFLEFNSSPALALPYCVRDGNHVDILAKLVPMIDRAITMRLS